MEDGVALDTYIRWFEEAETATQGARERSERDRDYYDGKQLTDQEISTLEKRGQPPISFNVIKSRVDYLLGLEKQQRRDPKAYPRNPQDQPAADAFTDALRFVADDSDYPALRTKAWKNLCVEGFGGLELYVQPAGDDYEIMVSHVPWDRIFYDPHSVREDFSDARFVGQVLWMDYDEACERYPEKKDILDATLGTAPKTDTYQDKPSTWADAKRKRVRVVSMWHRESGAWHLCEFTKGGELSSMPSPYQAKDGESLCPLILESAHVDRDNNRYGEVRNLIDPQDEINKRRSKALHLMTTRGVVMDEGAADKGKVRSELAKPDFVIEKTPGLEFEIVHANDMAAGQAQLGEQAMAYVMQSGPNAALLGKGTEDQSGRAIEAQQAGGLIELGDLMDALRRLDRRVFRMFAALIQQFWTAEKWIRVTDDELNPQYVGLNTPQLDEWGYPVGIENNVAELDVDIIVADAPDVIANQGEAYQALTQLLGSAPNIPPPMLRLLIEANPALTAKRKKQLMDMLESMNQEDPMAAQQAQVAQEGAVAEVERTKAEAFRAVAMGEAAMTKASQPQDMGFQPA